MINSRQSFKFSLLSIAIAAALPSYAQANAQTEIEQLRQEIKVLRGLIEQQQIKTDRMVANKFENVAEKNASKMSANAGTTFKFYGNVRLDASYQAEGSAADRLYNNINKVPLKGVGENSDRLKSTLAATRLGLDVQTKVNDQTVNGKVEVDFLGGATFDTLRIRHAYVNYGKWLLGQTWSNFAVPDYMPETIDALGYVGGAVKRTPQVRYTHTFNPSTALVIAAEDSKDTASNMRTPALTARLNHQINADAKLSLRTLVDQKRTTTDDTTAWGVGLGVQYNLTPKTTLKADYYHVDGDGSFVSWSNPSISKNTAGTIYDKNEFDSITAGITQQFNSQWRGTVGFGYMKFDVSDAYKLGVSPLTDINKEQWQGWVNAFYSPVKPISLGIEYVYGERKAVTKASNGQDTGEDNRVSAVAIYNF